MGGGVLFLACLEPTTQNDTFQHMCCYQLLQIGIVTAGVVLTTHVFCNVCQCAYGEVLDGSRPRTPSSTTQSTSATASTQMARRRARTRNQRAASPACPTGRRQNQ